MVEVEKMLLLWLVLFSISPATKADMGDSNVIKPECSSKCGNVSVPYPFGIGEASCAINNNFFLNCSDTNASDIKLFFANIPIKNISLTEGILSFSIDAAYKCLNQTRPTPWFNQSVSLGDRPFRFSHKRNKLTVVGCNTYAFMSDVDANFSSGCLNLCNKAPDTEQRKTCSGVGCCQSPIPPNLKALDITVEALEDMELVGYAFLADNETFNASAYGLSDCSDAQVSPDVVIEWVVSEETCEKAMENDITYACGRNTHCKPSDDGTGYRCVCNEGFKGNPYLPHPRGCQDIDECKEPKKYPCKEGSCKNTIGSYTCQCPIGMHGDGKVGCHGLRLTMILARNPPFFFVTVIWFFQKT